MLQLCCSIHRIAWIWWWLLALVLGECILKLYSRQLSLVNIKFLGRFLGFSLLDTCFVFLFLFSLWSSSTCNLWLFRVSPPNLGPRLWWLKCLLVNQGSLSKLGPGIGGEGRLRILFVDWGTERVEEAAIWSSDFLCALWFSRGLCLSRRLLLGYEVGMVY